MKRKVQTPIQMCKEMYTRLFNAEITLFRDFHPRKETAFTESEPTRHYARYWSMVADAMQSGNEMPVRGLHRKAADMYQSSEDRWGGVTHALWSRGEEERALKKRNPNI